MKNMDSEKEDHARTVFACYTRHYKKDMNLTCKHILFIGYVKAFDKVVRNKLWDNMRKKG
jgi:hypothetical protein